MYNALLPKESQYSLTLGPLFYNWDADITRDFYYKIADSDVYETVCIGEVVCSKRLVEQDKYMRDVVERLRDSGKKVVISSLALIMNALDEKFVNGRLNDFSQYIIEANDMGVASLLKGKDFAIGTFVNTYNTSTLLHLEKMGARRICLPIELDITDIKTLQSTSNVTLEVYVFGRAPLAIATRCYHARMHNLDKASCQLICNIDDNGMEVKTLQGECFTAVNGLQTLSYSYMNLLGDLDVLMNEGVSTFRLSPHMIDMNTVGQIFKDVIAKKITSLEGSKKLQILLPEAQFSNGFLYAKAGRTLQF